MAYQFADFFKSYDDDDAARAAEEALVAECGGGKWSDDVFTADAVALYKDPYAPPRGAPPGDVVQWHRISDGKVRGMDAPIVFHDGTAAGDVKQGQLGDCWFISAISVLAPHMELLKKLFVSTANADKGIYTIKFNKNGKWRYLHIDDYIPCTPMREPMYAHSKDPNETWVILLEKAYAKLHGTYENLIAGWTDYGMRDLTGGATMKLKWKDRSVASMLEKGTLWSHVKDKLDHKSLLGSSYTSRSTGREEDRGHGILAGHAYAVLRMEEVTAEEDGKELKLVQVRNPWGQGEWKGDWSDDDIMWEDYPSVRAALHPDDFTNDGSFWIEWKQFCVQFNQLFVCMNFPDEWVGQRFKGSWKEGDPESGHGGCPNYATFPKNPQYGFELQEESELVCVVSQQDNRWEREGQPYQHAIGFVVMHVGGRPRCTRFSARHMVALSRTFSPLRSIGGAFTLPPGDYVIVPCTYKPASGDIRVTTEVHCSTASIKFLELGDEIPDLDDAGEEEEEEADDGGASDEKDDDGSAFQADDSDEVEKEDDGASIAALHRTVAGLQKLVKGLIGDVKSLESKVAALEEG